MFVVPDKDLVLAVKKLEDAGFMQTPWSVATTDPKLLKNNAIARRAHEIATQGYAHFDANTVRFQYPSPSIDCPQRLVLIPSSYAHLNPPIQPSNSSFNVEG